MSEIKYQVNDDFLLREIAGEAVLVPTGDHMKIQNAMITLNETSQFLWKFFMEPHTIDEGIARVQQEYEGDPAAIRRDVTDFIMQGLPLELIREVK